MLSNRRFDRMMSPFHRTDPRKASWNISIVHDDSEESCSHSTSSVTSSASSETSRRNKRRVAFYPKVTAYPCPEKEITLADRYQRWMTRADLEAIKDDIRSTTSFVFDQKEFCAAIERLYDMVRRQNKYTVVDFDDNEEEDDHLCSGMTDLDLAHLLIDTDTRGLERMLFTRIDQIRGSLRPAAKHSKQVLQTQSATRHMPPEVRAEMIAEQCITQASSIWARTLGAADAEAVSMKFMLQF